MKFDEQKIQEVLRDGNYVSDADLTRAQAFAQSHHVSIVEYLISEELLTRDLLGQALAEFYRVPYAGESSMEVAERAARIPFETAKKFRLVFVEESKKGILLGTDDPSGRGLTEAAGALFNKTAVTIGYILPEEVDAVLAAYRKPLETRFLKIIEQQGRVAPEIIAEIISDALSFRASDIHFDPRGATVSVRFRVDGVMHEAGHLERQYYDTILNRIKVQSSMRIDEHFAAQDGSMHFEYVAGEFIDIRTSIIPTIEGEKIVLRLLGSYLQGLTLGELGLSHEQEKLIEAAVQRPFGMILVTGPTGSGKTSTLYALLKTLNDARVNIMTIEDPVEYKIAGVNQIQINAQTNLTFAHGLRSIIRQDPDVILVGEIRDRETVEIAVNAALTGHLLFSTFHTNDSATAIPRLLDMGSEPFLLASTLNLIVAQRLVRKICEHCRYGAAMASAAISPQSRALLAKHLKGGKKTVYIGKGCAACGHTGFRGRTAIFEFIQITPAMQDLILHSPSNREIWQLAHRQGSVSLFEDGLEKVKNGVTTIDELLRVAEPPSIV